MSNNDNKTFNDYFVKCTPEKCDKSSPYLSCIHTKYVTHVDLKNIPVRDKSKNVWINSTYEPEFNLQPLQTTEEVIKPDELLPDDMDWKPESPKTLPELPKKLPEGYVVGIDTGCSPLKNRFIDLTNVPPPKPVDYVSPWSTLHEYEKEDSNPTKKQKTSN